MHFPKVTIRLYIRENGIILLFRIFALKGLTKGGSMYYICRNKKKDRLLEYKFLFSYRYDNEFFK